MYEIIFFVFLYIYFCIGVLTLLNYSLIQGRPAPPWDLLASIFWPVGIPITKKFIEREEELLWIITKQKWEIKDLKEQIKELT